MRIMQRSEVDQPNSVQIRIQHVGGDFKCQTRFSNTAWPGESHQALHGQCAPDVSDLLGATNKGCELQGQVVLNARLDSNRLKIQGALARCREGSLQQRVV